MTNSPKNESEYFDLLARIVKGAEYLDNPLIKQDDFDKGMKLYDSLVDSAISYRRR